jgi:hypothetical protein
MRRVTAAVLLASFAGVFSAEARESTLALTCANAAALVASRGAVVLTTGEHTYDRFVVHNGFCALGEVAERALAPTLDSPRCPIGYTCAYRSRKMGLDN